MRRNKILLLLTMIAVIIVGCVPAPETPNHVSEPDVTATYAFIPLPATWTPIPTDVTPSETLPPAFTPTLTIKPSMASLPTLTPMPTLDSEEAKRKLNYMTNQNGGCKLPCWWGIVSGVSRLDETVNQIRTFLPLHKEYMTIIADGSGVDHIEVVPVFFLNENQHAFEFYSLDGEIEHITAYQNVTSKYSLFELMTTYGKPENVNLETIAFSPTSDPVPFRIHLFYPGKGISAFYDGGSKLIGSNVYFCDRQILPTLLLWDPLNTEFAKLINYDYKTDTIQGLQPIDKVSNLTVDAFYQAFTDPASNVCIVTPSDIWELDVPLSPLYNTSTPTPEDPFIETVIATP